MILESINRVFRAYRPDLESEREGYGSQWISEVAKRSKRSKPLIKRREQLLRLDY
jgi:hypothetical protein